MKKKLTQSVVQSLKPKEKPYYVTDSECSGLSVYVGKSTKTYYFKYRDKTSTQRKHKIGEAGDVLTVTQARIIANQLKVKLVQGESIAPEKPKARLTLGDFMNNIYAPDRLISNPKAGQQTLNMVRSAFAKRFYDCNIEDLDIKEFNAWRNERLASGRVKRTTVNKNINALNVALNWGVENGYFTQNPLQGMKKLKETDSTRRIRYLTDDERGRLLAALDERENRIRDGRESHNEWLAERDKNLMPKLGGMFADHLKPAVLLSLHTGIRRNTLFSLQWSDMNFETGILTMPGEIMKGGEVLRVPTTPLVFDVLTHWRDQSTKTGSNDLIFPSPVTGDKFKDVKKSWRGILKDAQIEDFRWHDMRHDFASQLVMKGVDLNTVSELMGHKDIKTTMIYAHLAPEHKMKAVKVLMETVGPNVLSGKRTSRKPDGAQAKRSSTAGVRDRS